MEPETDVAAAHRALFKHPIESKVHVGPNEVGEVIAAAVYAHAEASYLVRYTAADGRRVEAWWGESALNAA